jgi:hypothetical protein
MKYLKRIFESVSETNDIKEILTDLMDLDIIGSIGKPEIVRTKKGVSVVIKSPLKKGLIGTIRDLDKIDDSIETLSKIKTSLIHIGEISESNFTFDNRTLSIFLRVNSEIEKFFRKVDSLYYKVPKLKVNFYYKFTLHDDFSCTLTIYPNSWANVKLINESPELQDKISSEFDQYGFKFVRKWDDPDFSDDHMWFEFFIESVF